MRFLGIQSEFELPRLQAMRAEPPGLAKEGPRRRVFGAALEQWDQLLRASRTVGVEAAPILIFYAVSQATRALCAAAIPGSVWNPVGHGLSIKHDGPRLGATRVAPDGGEASSFAMLCRVLGSAPLSEPTTLGALWASNPHTESVQDLGDAEPPVLSLSPVGSGSLYLRARIEGEMARDLPADLDEALAVLRARLILYPAAESGLGIESISVDHRGAPVVDVSWKTAEGKLLDISAIAPGLAPATNSGAYLLPSLNASGDSL